MASTLLEVFLRCPLLPLARARQTASASLLTFHLSPSCAGLFVIIEHRFIIITINVVIVVARYVQIDTHFNSNYSHSIAIAMQHCPTIELTPTHRLLARRMNGTWTVTK